MKTRQKSLGLKSLVCHVLVLINRVLEISTFVIKGQSHCVKGTTCSHKTEEIVFFQLGSDSLIRPYIFHSKFKLVKTLPSYKKTTLLFTLLY